MEQIDPAMLDRLLEGFSLMDTALQMSTDLDMASRKLVIHWTTATHMLPHVDLFPLLVLLGPTGCGKSKGLNIISRFAYKPQKFVLRGCTLVSIRNKLSLAYEGTAAIEESDQAWKESDTVYERMLSDRYQRITGDIEVNEQSSKGGKWEPQTRRIFGATVVHRRTPWADAALEGRSIFVNFRQNYDRGYIDSNTQEWIRRGYDLVDGVTFTPAEIDRPHSIAPRVFDSYLPLIQASRVCRDDSFFDTIMDRLKSETEELQEAQSLEPVGLVFRAVLNINSLATLAYSNIKLTEVANWIFSNHSIRFGSRQIGKMARSLGFEIRESHGVSVIAPTPSALIRACRLIGYDESEIGEAKRKIPGWCSNILDEDG